MVLQCQAAAELGLWQEVRTAAERLLATVPEGALHTAARFWLAEAEFRTGNDDEARRRFDQLAELTFGLNEPWVPMIPLRLAQLAAHRQQWAEVLRMAEAFDREHKDFPLAYEMHYLRGRARAGRGEMTAARDAYATVLESPAAEGTETATMAQWMIGETFFHQRDYPRARDAYQRVVDEHRRVAWQARAVLQTGKCWELEGEWDLARSLYAEALERWPDEPPAEQLSTRLQWVERQVIAQKQQQRPLSVAKKP